MDGQDDIGESTLPQRARLFSENEWTQVAQSLGLSPQQARIVELILEGKGDKQIAADMGLQFSTVRTYLSRLFARFGANDRTHLVLKVFEHFRKDCRGNGCPRERFVGRE